MNQKDYMIRLAACVFVGEEFWGTINGVNRENHASWNAFSIFGGYENQIKIRVHKVHLSIFMTTKD